MSVTITLEADIKTNQKENLLTMLKKYLPQTKVYKGFIDISIHTQINSNHILFFEKWETVEDYESYLSWRTKTGVMQKLGMTFETAPIIRYYNTEDM